LGSAKAARVAVSMPPIYPKRNIPVKEYMKTVFSVFAVARRATGSMKQTPSYFCARHIPESFFVLCLMSTTFILLLIVLLLISPTIALIVLLLKLVGVV
jgi:hypothetical protein